MNRTAKSLLLAAILVAGATCVHAGDHGPSDGVEITRAIMHGITRILAPYPWNPPPPPPPPPRYWCPPPPPPRWCPPPPPPPRRWAPPPRHHHPRPVRPPMPPGRPRR